jgi:hypothetical protein
LASVRIIPRMTGNLEVMSSSVGLIPRNALVLTDLANFRVVGNPEVIPSIFRKILAAAVGRKAGMPVRHYFSSRSQMLRRFVCPSSNRFSTG